MHYIYSYLITGLILAALNDIFIIDGLVRNEHSEMPTIDKIICRVCISALVIVAWLPIGIYEIFFWKEENEK